MFNLLKKSNKIMAKNNEITSASINLVGVGTVIEGEIKSNGDIRVDGTVHGSVISKAKVVIGPTGIVEGDIVGQSADISGTIKGKSTVIEMLFLKSTAKINGDITTGKLIVEAGANFTGSCNMGPLIKEIKYGEKSGSEVQEKTA